MNNRQNDKQDYKASIGTNPSIFWELFLVLIAIGVILIFFLW